MPAERDFAVDSRRERNARRRELAIAELAERQHGVVSRAQLRETGFSDEAIDRRVGRGRLRAVHRGVYAAGRRGLSKRGLILSAVLACGDLAVASHRSAAMLWDLDSPGRWVEVTAPTQRRRDPAVRCHRGTIPGDERTVADGIPVTTVARTLLDLAAVVSGARLAQVVAIAEERRLADSPSLPDLMRRYRGRRGQARLRAVLARFGTGASVAWSELEVRFAEFCRRHDLPEPHRNVAIETAAGTLIVDCLWPDARLVVELDSHAHHSDWEAAERDRARDAALTALGYRIVRVTWRRLHTDEQRLAAEIRSALRRA
jgi:predicted transcriptional regulator of viral defense system